MDPLCYGGMDRTSEALPSRGAAPETFLESLSRILRVPGALTGEGRNNRPEYIDITIQTKSKVSREFVLQ